MTNENPKSILVTLVQISAEPIALRCVDGPLLAMLRVDPLRLEVKRNGRIFEVDLYATLATGNAVVFELTKSATTGSG